MLNVEAALVFQASFNQPCFRKLFHCPLWLKVQPVSSLSTPTSLIGVVRYMTCCRVTTPNSEVTVYWQILYSRKRDVQTTGDQQKRDLPGVLVYFLWSGAILFFFVKQHLVLYISWLCHVNTCTYLQYITVFPFSYCGVHCLHFISSDF